MRFTIDSVKADVCPERFREQYYEPRVPVVVRGLARDWGALRSWTPELLQRRVASAPEAVTRQPLWWDVDASLVERDMCTPRLIAHLRRHYSVVERGRPYRLWVSAGRASTPWHYDGNCVEVFNVQVSGRKRFTLVSPRTPVECAPFSILGRAQSTPPERLLNAGHQYTQVELEPGDMLYLPRHWFHYVESLAPQNTNLNWVWTDLSSGPLDAPTSLRERELLAAVFPLFALCNALVERGLPVRPPAVQQFNLDYARGYGGEADFAVARRFFHQTPWLNLVGRVWRELGGGGRFRRRVRQVSSVGYRAV